MKNKIKIDAAILYLLIREFSHSFSKKEYKGYIVINKKLTSADVEDGGGHYDLIIKEISTNKLYITTYCDWDMDNTSYDEESDTIGNRCDLNCILKEVISVEQTVTTYKSI